MRNQAPAAMRLCKSRVMKRTKKLLKRRRLSLCTVLIVVSWVLVCLLHLTQHDPAKGMPIGQGVLCHARQFSTCALTRPRRTSFWFTAD